MWCLVTHELDAGPTEKYWRDDLLKMRAAPFDIGPDVAVIAYYAAADWSCFLQLDWQLPACPIDLFAEYRVLTNRFIPRQLRGEKLRQVDGRGLYDALRRFGLEVGDVERKAAMRDLAMTQSVGGWTDNDMWRLMDYCDDDGRRTATLFRTVKPLLDWPQARLRGLYTLAVAVTEYHGIPIDLPLYTRLTRNWKALQLEHIAAIEAHYGAQLYGGTSFSSTAFARFLVANNLPWIYDGARLKLDEDTFEEMAGLYPEQLEPLRQTKSRITDLRMTSLKVGADGRARCMSSPFRTATGRTQPKGFIMGMTKWLQQLIRPPKGYGLRLFDWKAQEYAIFLARSGEERGLAAYYSGDPYIGFAIDAGLAPAGATEVSHPELRKRCKIICLGSIYGLTEHSAAPQLGLTQIEARHLLKRHARTYARGWEWREEIYHAALQDRVMATCFGWKWRPVPYCTVKGEWVWPTKRMICNFPCQAGAAEMMRLAAILTVFAGVELIATIHDALLIQAPLDRLEEAAARRHPGGTRNRQP